MLTYLHMLYMNGKVSPSVADVMLSNPLAIDMLSKLSVNERKLLAARCETSTSFIGLVCNRAKEMAQVSL